MTVRMRHTRAHTANRRSHHALANPAMVACECGASAKRHTMCPSCGKYRGKVIIDVAAAVAQKAAKRVKRQEENHKGSGQEKVEEKK